MCAVTVQLTPSPPTVDLETNTWAEQIKTCASIDTEPDQVRDPPPYLTHAHLFAPLCRTFFSHSNGKGCKEAFAFAGMLGVIQWYSTKLCHQSGQQVHVFFGEVSRTSSYSMVCAPSGHAHTTEQPAHDAQALT